MIDGGKEKSGLRDDDTSIMFFVALLYVVKNMCFCMIVNNNSVLISTHSQ